MIVYEDMCVGCPPDVCGRGYCPYSKPIFTSAIDVKTIVMIAYTYIMIKNFVIIVFMTK